MSNMESLQPNIDEKVRQNEVYQAALSSIDASKRNSERNGYAILAVAMNYGLIANGAGAFGKVSHGAKLFTIGFAVALPPLHVWYMLL